MTADRWQEIRKLFEECLKGPVTGRAIFLAVHAEDPELRDQVERLLEHHDQAEVNFLTPPEAVVHLFQLPDLLTAGSVVARRFEIVRLIGRGGMAEVYEAYDTELRESIAVKALRTNQWEDPENVGRCLRELQLSRRISHVNVCRVFDFLRHREADGELTLITMELVEGITLEERIKQGPISQALATAIARQLLSGMAAAHEAGVIHRDLKPSNIMLAGERVAIMDFGVACSEFLLSPDSFSAKRTSKDSSRFLIGTLNYMAPEQLLGDSATKQSDLYALGLVLYEAVYARKPFTADCSLAGLLQRLEADLQPPSSSSKALGRAIGWCLKRNPADRPRSASQILELLEQEAEEETLLERRSRVRNRLVFIGFALTFVLAVILGKRFLGTGSPSAEGSPEFQHIVPFTDMRGTENYPAFSPDGKTIAFTWNKDHGSASNVYTKSLTGGPIRQITFDSGSDTHPAWSSDGEWIAYIERLGSAGNLMVTSAAGEKTRRLTFLPISRAGIGWSHHGHFLAYTQITFEGAPGELHLLNFETREDTTITAPPRAGYGDFDPAFSPDDRWIAFVRFRSQDQNETEIDLLPIDAAKRTKGVPVPVTKGSDYIQGLTWTRYGDSLIFSSLRDGHSLSLWRIKTPFRQRLHAPAEQITFGGTDATYPSASPNGEYLAYQLNITAPTQITRLNLKARSKDESPACPSSQADTTPQLSSNGEKMYFVSQRSGAHEIWGCTVQTGEAQKLTSFNGALIGSPRLSPTKGNCYSMASTTDIGEFINCL